MSLGLYYNGVLEVGQSDPNTHLGRKTCLDIGTWIVLGYILLASAQNLVAESPTSVEVKWCPPPSDF